MAKRYSAIFLLLLLLVNTCAACYAGTFDEALHNLTKAIGESVKYDFEKRIIPDLTKIIRVLQVFHEQNKRYPKSYSELSKYARDNDIDMKLEAISDVAFTWLEDGRLTINYNVVLTASKILSSKAGSGKGAPKPSRQRVILRPKEGGEGFDVNKE